jgi:hypothetical protein
MAARSPIPNIQCEKWEAMLDEDLVGLRARYGITAASVPALIAS